MKSSSANVGALELSALAKELEFKGRQNDTADLVNCKSGRRSFPQKCGRAAADR
ncbi:MAG: hypothetical protein P8Z77_10490 [Candidatus Thiodiazotropha sp.]